MEMEKRERVKQKWELWLVIFLFYQRITKIIFIGRYYLIDNVMFIILLLKAVSITLR